MWSWFLTQLFAQFRTWLNARLDAIDNQLEKIIMTEADIEALLTQIDTETTRIAGVVQAGVDQIAALQAQIAAGTPVTQEQLDALGAHLTTEVATLQGIGKVA